MGAKLPLPILAVFFLSALSAAAPDKYRFDAPFDGPTSRYTQKLIDLVRSGGITRQVPRQGEYPVGIQCYSTEGAEFYVGAAQTMSIQAPLSTVDRVLLDVDHYRDIFPGYKDIHVQNRDSNMWSTFWEQNVPLFFVPNVKYEMWYVIDHSQPNRVIYRYQLKKSEKIKKSDGVILIEAKAENQTSYTEYDFWDADYGLLKTVAPGKIWEDSVEGLFLSDMGVKLKAENPEWSYEKIREEAKNSYKGYPIERVLKDKKTL